MKKLLTTTAAALLTVAAFGQGVVNFSNASSTPGWANPALDRYAHWKADIALFNPALQPGGVVASNSGGLNLGSLRAALYYAASTDFDPNFVGYVQAAGGLATFKTSTSATAGSWFGGNRTLDSIGLGTTANLVVLVWDSSLTTDPLSAAARGGLFGASAVFQYTPPTNPQAQPSDFLMTGLTGFSVGAVPEPTTLALAGLGAAALIIARRRK
jgi:hypothetical protein